MKRKRKPTFCRTQMGNTGEQNQVFRPSISDLPTTIFVEILLKLSTKSITLCKCVCKSWYSLISDSQFANVHLAQAKTCLLIRDVHHLRVSRALYLLEPDDGQSFDVGYCWCNDNEKCNRCRPNVKVKARLKMPLRNAQVMFSQLRDDTNVVFHVENNSRKENLIKLKSKEAHTYKVANSCNGLLCLTDRLGRDPFVVCNPILGEFIHLPNPSYDGKSCHLIRVGLGFSPRNNQYKVMGIIFGEPNMAGIHTLGTDSWRKVEISTFKLKLEGNPIHLDVALHWICGDDNNGSQRVVSFDLDEEQFRFYSIPSPPCQQGKYLDLFLGVLGGCLCVHEFYSYGDHIDLWVMKDYGICESWTKLFSINIGNELWSRCIHSYQPISYLSNGALLMFCYGENELIYYDESRGLRFKHLRFQVIRSEFEAIAHTPSFISLKDIVSGSNVEVLNVNSRCGKLQLVEETYPLLLERRRRVLFS